VLTLKEHRSRVVKASLINLIPRLSEYCPDAFVRSYLDDSLDILIRCMKTPELRGVSLLAIGRLCRTMGSHLSYRVEELVNVVREALIGSGAKRMKEIPPEALKCVSDMVCGLGVSFHYRVLGLLDAMLHAGLTEELIEALAVIASNMPMHKEVVHQRLLEEIVKVLGGVRLGNPQPPAPPPQKSMWPFRSSKPPETAPSPAPEGNKAGQMGKKMMMARQRKSFSVHHSSGPEASDLGGIQLAPTIQNSNADAFTLFGNFGVNSQDESMTKPRNYNTDLVLLALRTLRMLSTPSSGLLVLIHRCDMTLRVPNCLVYITTLI
jgi:hypothetical protein